MGESETFTQAGLKVAPSIKIEKSSLEQILDSKFHIPNSNFGLPWVVKPASRGSSVGVSLVNNEKEFQLALEKAFQYDDFVLAEKYIKGREVTSGILENFQGEKYFVLPAVEIIPPSDKFFFDEQCKYDGTTQEICPGRFNEKMTLIIQETARRAHLALGCRDYSRVDMIVAEDGIYPHTKDFGVGVYVLEVNTLPGLTDESLFPKAAAVIGLSFDRLLDHLLTLALKRKGA